MYRANESLSNEESGVHRKCPCYACPLCFCLFILVAAAVLATLAILSKYQKIKISVEKAQLTQFNLSNGRIIYNSLFFDIKLRNPNLVVSMHHSSFEPSPMYHDQRIHLLYPTISFNQGPRNTTTLHFGFNGSFLLPTSTFGNNATEHYIEEKARGLYEIVVKMGSSMRSKKQLWGSSTESKMEADCGLRVPLVGKGNANIGEFARSKCKVHTHTPKQGFSCAKC